MSGHIQNICKAEHNFFLQLSFYAQKIIQHVPTLSEKKHYNLLSKNKQKTMIGIEKKTFI